MFYVVFVLHGLVLHSQWWRNIHSPSWGIWPHVLGSESLTLVRNTVALCQLWEGQGKCIPVHWVCCVQTYKVGLYSNILIAHMLRSYRSNRRSVDCVSHSVHVSTRHPIGNLGNLIYRHPPNDIIVLPFVTIELSIWPPDGNLGIL